MLLYAAKSQMCFSPKCTQTGSSPLSFTHELARTSCHLCDVIKTCLLSIKNYRSCALPSLHDGFFTIVMMESLLCHFFSLLFICCNYRWKPKKTPPPSFFLFFSPSYLSFYALSAFRGALTAAFLLGTCLKGSRSMWCPLTIRYSCFFVCFNKPSKHG